jgi:hypothetical protein
LVFICKSSLKELNDKIRTDPRIQEIVFYPKIYGRKIFTYTIIEPDLEDHIISICNFYLQKTANTDVYNLLSIDSEEQVDIAYIPDILTSKKCQSWFKLMRTKKILVKCQLDVHTNKWVPFEIVE